MRPLRRSTPKLRHVVAVDLAAGARAGVAISSTVPSELGNQAASRRLGAGAGTVQVCVEPARPGRAPPAPTGACGAAASCSSRRVRRLLGLGLGLGRRRLRRGSASCSDIVKVKSRLGSTVICRGRATSLFRVERAHRVGARRQRGQEEAAGAVGERHDAAASRVPKNETTAPCDRNAAGVLDPAHEPATALRPPAADGAGEREDSRTAKRIRRVPSVKSRPPGECSASFDATAGDPVMSTRGNGRAISVRNP